MYTLNQVIEGLKVGKSYERTLEGDGGKEYVTPIGDGEFRHDVAGEAHDGWGGTNTMPIEILNNGRWHQEGWELSI
jgi:hypothetical protein